jgi:hypothetical protein
LVEYGEAGNVGIHISISFSSEYLNVWKGIQVQKKQSLNTYIERKTIKIKSEPTMGQANNTIIKIDNLSPCLIEKSELSCSNP